MARPAGAIPAHLRRTARPVLPVLSGGEALHLFLEASRANPLLPADAPLPVPPAFLAQHPLAPASILQGLLACLHDGQFPVIRENGGYRREAAYNPALSPASAALLAASQMK